MFRGLRASLRRWRARRSRSLGFQLVLILTGVGLAGSAAIALLLAMVITPGFTRLEESAVTGHVERTRVALDEFASKVQSAVRDYGDWSASYDYMASPTPEFEEDSFSPLAMANLGVNAMAYVAPDGRIVIARWLDLDRLVDLPDERIRFEQAIAGIDLKRALAGGSSASFYLKLGDTLAAVGVAHVRRSDGTGVPRGYVLMARTLGLEQLGTLLQLEARIGPPASRVTIDPHSSTVHIGVPITGPIGQAVATAGFEVKRDLSLLGWRMLLFAVIGTILLMVVILVVLRLLIAKQVLKPLRRVERHMGVVRSSGQLSPLTDGPRHDEIGSLVASFNSMLRQLEDLREQVEIQSYKLGQSESAVAVMHNVRNALNPISTVLSQGLGHSPELDRLVADRAIAELAGDEIPLARRQKLAAYLLAAAAAVDAEREERKAQLAIGREALRNVLDIIGRQQEQAHEKPQLAPCDLTEIVAQNATIARYSGASSIAFSFPSRPHPVLANRVILSQVVGNLFANAAEAIGAAGRGGGSIAVTIAARNGMTELVIRDDGEGFDPAIGPTLFQRGFSTREHKSGGLGLHWCANAILAMDGTLALVSEGRGTGARAVLRLRAAAAVEAAEAPRAVA